MKGASGKDSNTIIWDIFMGFKSVFDFAIRLVGPIFVIIATVLISGVIVIFFRAILPYYGDYTSFFGLTHIAIGGYFTFCIYFNYFMAIFTSPGGVPEDHKQPNTPEQTQGETSVKKGQGFSRYCKECKKPKPPRSHHCSICKRCVLKMDHHCPWISNCVGFYNHKYFVLFMFYLWVGCLYVATMSYVPFQVSSDFKVPWKGFSSRGTIIFTFVITVAVSIALGFMLIWQLYLVFTNQTTIEFYFNKYKQSQAKSKGEIYHNPFDLGVRKNLQLFFGLGHYWFSWALPSTQPPTGDGCDYPERSNSSASYV